MIDLSRVRNYYVACGYTDLRRGIDGLAAIVMSQYGMELREDSLFLFCGRRTDRIKALYWSGDGYVLIYKRLSNGAFQWPRSTEELKSLDAQSFRWLMEGLKIEQPKAIRKDRQKSLFAKGAGHFKNTSIWNGNVSIAGHNRGANCYFADIHTLVRGDTITLTTKLGTRTYSVTEIKKISELDDSDTEATAENCITLFTCVRNQSEYRWCVRAVER